MRDRDERARLIVAIRKIAFAQLYKLVAVARIVDEHRHGDEIGEAAAATLERLVDQAEDRAYLRLELSGDIVAGLVAGRGLTGEPGDSAALRDDGRRVRARRLELSLLEIFGH